MSSANFTFLPQSFVKGLSQSNNTDNHLVRNDQNTTNTTASPPIHLSETVSTIRSQPETPRLGAPEISIQPKSEVHARNMKELGKQEIPFLPGEGPQRTPIQVKVSHC